MTRRCVDASIRETPAGRLAALMFFAQAAMLLAACEDTRPRAEVLVQRAFLTPAQKVLDFSLQSRRAMFTRDESEWRRVLLAFPLPGSTASHATYAVFVQFRGDRGDHSFGPGCEAQAVFIHLARRAGEFRLVSLASVGELHTKPRAGGRVIAGQIRFSTPDGLTVSGPFVAAFSPDIVGAFEHDYVAPQIVHPKPAASGPHTPSLPALPSPPGRPFDFARLRAITTRGD